MTAITRRGLGPRASGALAKTEIDPRFVPVVRAFARRSDVVLAPGWGKGNLVLKVGDRIFALLGSAGFVAKLPKARVDELVAAGEGTRFDPRKNGRVMKEWLVAPSGADWVSLAREAHRFVGRSFAQDAKRAP